MAHANSASSPFPVREVNHSGSCHCELPSAQVITERRQLISLDDTRLASLDERPKYQRYLCVGPVLELV